ncbi:neck protein [Arthrobacter phage Gisselle]|uniref:Uncharacterized protein n=1 Tax=Arthrobacter phage Gisselle TaxID=2743905 RepID=A0AAE7F900_9CAUD|nr:neck protein [Arthrobacter phage Gisselle]QDH48914.1 hypothetical protein SEA_DREAMTEAM_9 [Arthrobacter phage DreamTeam]QKY79315.1 hypothetical protein SEA_GISSELLE_9 [Arthrobacter phage Gisselle]
MAEEVKVVLNDAGIKALLNSPEVQAHLLKAAQNMAQAAESRSLSGAVYEDENPKFEASVQPGRSRARASVITANKEARIAEAQDRALSSSIDALRS